MSDSKNDTDPAQMNHHYPSNRSDSLKIIINMFHSAPRFKVQPRKAQYHGEVRECESTSDGRKLVTLRGAAENSYNHVRPKYPTAP
jgi:hypothetical protein